jgi:hypothetical protein
VIQVDRLCELEAVIQRGLASFVEVGNALLEVRESRLYRAEHATFEDYCKERWGMDRRYANRIIEAVEVANLLGPMGPIPESERQARELVPLKAEPAKLREAWQAVQSSGAPITAAAVREAVIKVLPTKAASPAPKHIDTPAPMITKISPQERAERISAIQRVSISDSEIDDDVADEIDPRISTAEASRVFDELSDACVLFANMKSPVDFIAALPLPIREYPIHHFRIAFEWLAEFLEVVK